MKKSQLILLPVILSVISFLLYACSTSKKVQQGPAVPVSREELKKEEYDINYEYHSIEPEEESIAEISDAGQFKEYKENGFIAVAEQPISTFSADTDTSSYVFVKAQIEQGYMPRTEQVRVEEFINYFDYDYQLPASKQQPFQPNISIATSPWNDKNKLVHIGIKAYDIPESSEKPASNLVFLIDVSGSMAGEDRLELVKKSISLLLPQLDEKDTISIVSYAGDASIALKSTHGNNKRAIKKALKSLEAGGATHGSSGIDMAYNLASDEFDNKKVNRIILMTDGDFNVGTSSNEGLLSLVEEKRKTGIYLSVFGFGMDNYNDGFMQTLAQNGNGNASYISSLQDAQKSLVEESSKMLFPVAKDVKFQVEFNPALVSRYRLLGYETRLLDNQDFDNDSVDAGEVNSGHAVTAIYEIISPENDRIEYRYKQNNAKEQETKMNIENDAFANELGFLKIRYKQPDSNISQEIKKPILINTFESEKKDVEFSIAVAGFAQLLQQSKNISNSYTHQQVLQQAEAAKGKDSYGYRSNFIQLVRMSNSLN